MGVEHQYQITTKWTGNSGSGTDGYRNYERSHTIVSANKPEIFASSDSAFRGDNTKYNPEELLLAAISGCHMLSYLHLCAVNGIIVTGYTDTATGIMVQTADGGGHFQEATLNLTVIVKDLSMIEKANQLHHDANKICFIANSCNFPIYHKSVCTSQTVENF